MKSLYILLGLGVGGFLLLKSGVLKSIVPSHPTSTPLPQTTKNPSSAQVKSSPNSLGAADTSQPWYRGPVIAGAGLGLAALATAGAAGISSLFSSNDSGEEIDTSDVDLAENDFASFGSGNDGLLSDMNLEALNGVSNSNDVSDVEFA